MTYTFIPKTLGGGFNGISPRIITTTQQGNSMVAPLNEISQIPRDRTVLRDSFPTTSTFDGKYVLTTSWPQTPFRVAMNAGDLLLRQTEPGGPNQVKGTIWTRPGGFPSKQNGVHKGNGASGNQHYVYDSSVYTRYRRLYAKNKNYNDFSFGGDQHNASQVALAAIKRF